MAGNLPPKRRKSKCRCHVMVLRFASRVSWFALPCKSWGCVHCRPKLAARWGHTIRKAADKGFKPQRFLTITLDPAEIERRCGCRWCVGSRKGERSKDCLLLDYKWQQEFFYRAWTRLLARVRRLYGRTVFWKVYEFHAGKWDPSRGIRNFRLHLHALIDSAMPGGGYSPEAVAKHGLQRSVLYGSERDKWAKFASELGLGLTKCYDLVEGSDVWGYVFKYAAKLKPEAYERKVRMVSCSRGIRHDKMEGEKPVEAQVVVLSKSVPFKVEEMVAGAGGFAAFFSWMARRMGAASIQDGSVASGPPGCLDYFELHRLPRDNYGRAVWRPPARSRF